MKYLVSKDGIQFGDTEYGSFISAVSAILNYLNEGEAFYVLSKDDVFCWIRKYVVEDGNAVWVPNDYENEPLLRRTRNLETVRTIPFT